MTFFNGFLPHKLFLIRFFPLGMLFQYVFRILQPETGYPFAECHFIRSLDIGGKIEYMVQLAENITLTDPLAASRYSSALTGNLQQGYGINEATQLATNTMNNILQQQSTLLALKHILGWLFAVTLVISVISRFIPFHKTVRVPVIHTGEDMV